MNNPGKGQSEQEPTGNHLQDQTVAPAASSPAPLSPPSAPQTPHPPNQASSHVWKAPVQGFSFQISEANKEQGQLWGTQFSKANRVPVTNPSFTPGIFIHPSRNVYESQLLLENVLKCIIVYVSPACRPAESGCCWQGANDFSTNNKTCQVTLTRTPFPQSLQHPTNKKTERKK